MPKLTIFKRDKTVLSEAEDICRVLVAHNYHGPVAGMAATAISRLRKLMDGEADPDDEDGGAPTDVDDAEEK